MTPRTIRRPAVAVLLAALLATCGCASGRLPSGSVTPGRDLVSGAEIARWPPGSAQRAFVAWWRDAQYANFSGFKALVRSRHTPAAADALVDALSSLMQSARPTSIVATRTRDGATLRVTVTVHQPVGAGKLVDQRFTLRVPLLRRQGGWQVADGFDWAQRQLVAGLRPLTGGNRG